MAVSSLLNVIRIRPSSVVYTRTHGLMATRQDRDGDLAHRAMQVYTEYSADRHREIDARVATIGPDVYRTFRGWELNRQDEMHFRLMALVEQGQSGQLPVLRGHYGIAPDEPISRIRAFSLSSRLLTDLERRGYPVDEIRRLRGFAVEGDLGTRVFDYGQTPENFHRLLP